MKKYVIRKTDSGYQFTMESDNNEIIAVSRNYKTIMECHSEIVDIQKNAAVSMVETE